ncbi:MAG: PmoA family protein [Planctomycetia bacterium]|nr:PmoA family protein [Planctomycetia bacterium]
MSSTFIYGEFIIKEFPSENKNPKTALKFYSHFPFSVGAMTDLSAVQNAEKTNSSLTPESKIHAPLQNISFRMEENNTVAVYVGEKLFTKYVPEGGNSPILFPIKSACGENITRAFPIINNVRNESHDHPHHRSFWLAHGNVHGINFWNESGKPGKIVFREFISKNVPTLAAKSEWCAPDGSVLCTDICSMTFAGNATTRWIDLKWEITAGEKDLCFGDTKEGTFALRVASSMEEERKSGGKIINSDGFINENAWGKRAAWVDYHGMIGEKKLGITIMNHPKSDFYPTYWHVRTYGLFAANPFGVHAFTRHKNKNAGDFILKAGKTMTLIYRVYIHPGDETEGNVIKCFEEFQKLNF